MVKKICAEELKISKKKKYYCFKCNKKMCQACIVGCQEGHREWIEDGKEIVVFKCQTSIGYL